MTTLKTDTMRNIALRFASFGWAVHALSVSKKQPGTPNGFLDATTDPDEIARMWAGRALANVGIATGASNLLVVDVDMNHAKGKVGDDSWGNLIAQHGHVPTFTVQTWSGGLHFYYQMPQARLPNSTSVLGQDIDTRGDGGYVVAPGSRVIEDGATGWYTIINDLDVAPCPEWIVEALNRPAPQRERLAGPVAPEDLVLTRMDDLAQQLREAPDGTGNDMASRVAFMAGQYVGAGQIGQQQAIDILTGALADWSWRSSRDQAGMRETIERQVSAGMRVPRAWERPVAPNAPRGDVEPLPTSLAVDPDPEGAADPLEEADRDISYWSTDNGQGVFLRDRLGRMIFVVGVGWFVWDKKRWAPVDEAVIEGIASRFYRQQFGKILDQYKTSQKDKHLVLAKAYKQFMSTGRLKSIMGHLKLTDGVQVTEAARLDSHHHLLNTQNGVVNLVDGTLSPHDPDLLITKITKGSYRPGFTHPDWQQALTCTEEPEYLQLRFGQAFTGETSKDVAFLIGGGQNGKSLFTTDGLVHAMGDYAHQAQRSLISKGNGREGAATPDRALLRGRRFVWIEELPEAHSLSVEEIKSVADTGKISARLLNTNPTTFDATHTLFVTSNSLPAVSETDYGTWRRLMRVTFPWKYTEHPVGPTERPLDPGLKARIAAGRDGQHEAIIAWVVAGAMRYYTDRAAIIDSRRPQSIKDATLQWQVRADRIMGYIDERVEFVADSMVWKKDLLDDFNTWLASQGHSKWGLELFLNRFMDHKLVTDAGVVLLRTRDHDAISRPMPSGASFSSSLGNLPMQVRALRGIRFVSN